MTIVDLIDQSNFIKSNCNAFLFDNTQINAILNTQVAGYLNAINMQHSNSALIQNLTVSNWNNTLSQKGGAIYALSSNITILSSSFIDNTAIEGAAIYIDWVSGDYWYSKLENVNFTNNIGQKSGGAISYNLKRPQLANNIFSNNSAPYGSNIASYPVRVYQKESSSYKITIDNVASGIQLQALVLVLVDYDNQTMVLDSTSQLKILPSLSLSKVSGINVAKLWNGIASFGKLIFISNPGSQNVIYQILSKAIDEAKLLEVFGRQAYSNSITVSFRFCQPGEIIQNNQCKTWAPGTYSLSWNSTVWINWMNNAVWLGGTQVSVASGYWRKTSNSTTIVEWPNPSAWNGKYVDQEMFPVECNEGYAGYLWASWTISNGTKYEQTSSFECSKWPNPILNAIRVIGVIVLAFIFLMILIIINIRKIKESQTSILLRILTNYLQLISVTLSFNMKFPTEITDLFLPMQKVSSSGTFLSFDWFIENTEIKAFAPNNSIFKLFLTALLPIIIFVFACLVFTILKIAWSNRFGDIKRNIGISVVWIIFLLHPTLSRESFSIFQCIDADSGDSRMRLDLGNFKI